MNEKNPDVDRVLAVFGGAVFPYLSLGPVVLHPRIALENMPFVYNEIGEPEYVPQRAPLSVAPAATAAPILPVAAAAPVEAPVKRMAPPSLSLSTTARIRPTAQAETSGVIPFFPLLAAAMPNATESGYGTTPDQASPSEPEIAVPLAASDESLALFSTTMAASDPLPPIPPAPAAVMSAAEASDRLSLAEMFAALDKRQSGTVEVEPPRAQILPNKAVLPKSSGTQAMFRRI